MRRAVLSLVGMCALSCGLAACAQFPELDAVVAPGVYEKDFPRILPLDPLLVSPERTVTPALEADIGNRVAGLRARATRLSGPVVDAATKRRMARGVR